MKRSLLVILFLTLIFNFLQSQMVGPDCYMKNNWVEFAINGMGGFEGVDINVNAPPAGYHWRSNNPIFGFTANPQNNGWLTQDGDFFSPGSPENGWGVQMINTTAGINYQGSNNSDALLWGGASPGVSATNDIDGAIVSYTVTPTCKVLVWEGNYIGSTPGTWGYDSLWNWVYFPGATDPTHQLHVRIEYILGNNDLFYTTKVTLTNTGTATIPEFYYYRNFDPDNNVSMAGGEYSTTNTIVSQSGTGCNKAHVSATSTLPATQPLSYVGLAGVGSMFRVVHGGFSNRIGSEIWNATGWGFAGTTGSVLYSDIAIAIAYRINNFLPGQSETIKYVVILDDLAANNAVSNLFSFSYPGSAASISTSACNAAIDTVTICAGGSTPINLGGSALADFNWTWGPATGLSTTAGGAVIASPTTSTTYTITGAPINPCYTAVNQLIHVRVIPAATTVTWTSGVLTDVWTNASNWNNCGPPSCTISAIVGPVGAGLQPTLTAGIYNVNNLTINAGGTLTLNAGSTLRICGNFTNNGNLVCNPGSTIEFVGAGTTQTVSGSHTGANAWHHCVVNKTGGSVVLATNVDMRGNFTTSNITSIFNANNRIVRVAGNFSNFSGNTTYPNTTGTLEFFGSTSQNYNQGSTQLDLNNVIMNQTGAPGVVLLTDMFIKTATGTLTLTNGRINTGTFRVDVANGTPASVSVGNTNSYVNGNLWRTLSGAAGAFNFPVGTATLYERALVTFTTATTIPRLQARFDPWPAAWPIQGSSECVTTYNIAAQNMGYWTINATATPLSGNYNMNLYCQGATNTAGVSGWTVMKSSSVAGPWILSGTCAASTVSNVARINMNGFSVFGAAQATNPLPVEFLSFTGEPIGSKNKLMWTTATEINSDYFAVERSADGIEFEEIGRVDAAGNSNTELDYTYFDHHPFVPGTYYRLRQVDFDGNTKYSDMIYISTETPHELIINSIHPNPFNHVFNIDLFSPSEDAITVSVMTSLGQAIATQDYLVNGSKTILVDGSIWANGVYFVKVISKTTKKEQVFKVIKD